MCTLMQSLGEKAGVLSGAREVGHKGVWCFMLPQYPASNGSVFYYCIPERPVSIGLCVTAGSPKLVHTHPYVVVK